MPENDQIKMKLARSLIRQREPSYLKKLITKYLAGFVVLFIIHSYFSNLESPLKLIPQTMAALGMGYMIFFILALKQFAHVVEFIDWEKVESYAEQSAGENASRPTA